MSIYSFYDIYNQEININSDSFDSIIFKDILTTDDIIIGELSDNYNSILNYKPKVDNTNSVKIDFNFGSVKDVKDMYIKMTNQELWRYGSEKDLDFFSDGSLLFGNDFNRNETFEEVPTDYSYPVLADGETVELDIQQVDFRKDKTRTNTQYLWTLYYVAYSLGTDPSSDMVVDHTIPIDVLDNFEMRYSTPKEIL